MSEPSAVADASDPKLSMQLSREEDDELRRLNYMAGLGVLSGEKLERLRELSQRDRRHTIRPPREFAPSQPRAKRSGLKGLLSRD